VEGEEKGVGCVVGIILVVDEEVVALKEIPVR